MSDPSQPDLTDDPFPLPGDRSAALIELTHTADRLDALADTAELMGDDDGAARIRAHGSACRERAMSLLDD